MYLQQHADNPVDWMPWGEAPFIKAQKENKLILVSIGYSSCHWCHVMEHESFEDEEVAQYMNDNFVSIKVDREEHPEVDSYYMTALQAMMGQGGWPLNIFLTPEGKPFYGGTYFPPMPVGGRMSWLQVLMTLQKAWSQQDPQIMESADRLRNFMHTYSRPKESAQWNPDEILASLKTQSDRDNGGFSSAPKFPMLMTLDWMLSLALEQGDEEALQQMSDTLEHMLLGGIYDQVGGGLMRYSTDDRWLVPHFEKMLYTQAQLLPLLARMHYLFPERNLWKHYLDLELDFIQNKLKNEQGYASSIDADSADGEGYYYSYKREELEAIVAREELDYALVSPDFEGRNILHFDAEPDFSRWDPALRALRDLQKNRDLPQTDAKSICSWNAYLAVGFARSYIYTGDVMYLELFTSLYKKLDSQNLEKTDQLKLWRIVYPSGQKVAGLAEDYALFGLCSFYAFRFTQEEHYLDRAVNMIDVLEDRFWSKGAVSQAPSDSPMEYASSHSDDMIPDSDSLYLELLGLAVLLRPDTERLSRYRSHAERLQTLVMQAPLYRSYAGKQLSDQTKLSKVETNQSWQEISTPLRDYEWLKKLSSQEPTPYIRVCNMDSCQAPISGDEACKNFWEQS